MKDNLYRAFEYVGLNYFVDSSNNGPTSPMGNICRYYGDRLFIVGITHKIICWALKRRNSGKKGQVIDFSFSREKRSKS